MPEKATVTIESKSGEAWQFHTKGICTLKEFTFDCGITLHNVQLSFATWGLPNDRRDNVVLVCHALTGNPHVAGLNGWWSDVVGVNKAIDTLRSYVISINVLGGCDGSSGPTTLASDGRPYGLYFPLVTIRDIVRAQVELLDALGIEEVALVIGGSLGGMQAWEWPLVAPTRVHHAIAIAADASFSPLAIGYNAAMRQAITADSDWHQGDYYSHGVTPAKGMGVARAIGMLTYRSSPLFEERFGRVRTNSSHNVEWTRQGGSSLVAFTRPIYMVESYLEHHGKKLGLRFDANSYLYLTRAMDNHDIGADRGGEKEALRQVKSKLTVIGIDTDYLYPEHELQRTVSLAKDVGIDITYLSMKSIHGHDAFLVDQTHLGELIQSVVD